jgi:hypothetical protein
MISISPPPAKTPAVRDEYLEMCKGLSIMQPKDKNKLQAPLTMEKHNSKFLYNMMMPAFNKTQSMARKDLGMGPVMKPQMSKLESSVWNIPMGKMPS